MSDANAGGSGSKPQGQLRRVGLTDDLPQEWIDAVRNAEEDPRYKHLDDLLKDWNPVMNHGDFTIGETFWFSDMQWRCTDIGTRVIIAIRIDSVEVGSTDSALRRTLNRSEAEAEGWFKGPPYAGPEVVFDEYDIEGCTLEPETEEAT